MPENPVATIWTANIASSSDRASLDLAQSTRNIPRSLTPAPHNRYRCGATLWVVGPSHVADQRDSLFWPEDCRLVEPASYKKVEIQNLNPPRKRRNVHKPHDLPPPGLEIGDRGDSVGQPGAPFHETTPVFRPLELKCFPSW